jgi:hypothetical protein
LLTRIGFDFIGDHRTASEQGAERGYHTGLLSGLLSLPGFSFAFRSRAAV